LQVAECPRWLRRIGEQFFDPGVERSTFGSSMVHQVRGNLKLAQRTVIGDFAEVEVVKLFAKALCAVTDSERHRGDRSGRGACQLGPFVVTGLRCRLETTGERQTLDASAGEDSVCTHENQARIRSFADQAVFLWSIGPLGVPARLELALKPGHGDPGGGTKPGPCPADAPRLAGRVGVSAVRRANAK
jgi:hypothetical protein